MLRSLVIGQLGRYGDPETIEESKKRFMDHVSEKDPLAADVKTAVFTTCLKNGDETTFDHLIKVC